MNFSSISSVTLKFCFFITITAATLKLCFIFTAIPTANHNKYISAYPADNGQNSLSLVRGSTSKTLLHIFGDGDTKAIFAIIMITLVNVFVYVLWDYVKEGMKASARGQRVCRIFSLAEIQSATNNFDAGCVIGKGGFGQVYKGSIDKGRKKVAVKRLKFSSSQGEREFLTEIKTLSKLRNNNLVSLIGYCNEPGEMILVYKYMTLGSLSDHLFKHSSSLSWTRRLNICIGAGQGLDYVHRNHGIIHRDVKSSNILLDKNFVAKVSDFGLARPETRSESQCDISTNVKGTRGYLDPNYVSTGKPTRESDTYSFGVVLLEVLCGRPARDQRAEQGEEYLVTWAQAKIRDGEVEKIVSTNLRGKISPESLKTFVKVVQSCLHMDPNKRPTMGQVVEQLVVALEQQECQNSWGAPVRVPANEIVVGDEAVGLTTTTIDNLTIDEQNVASSSQQQSNENVVAEPAPYTKDELELSIPIDCDRLGLVSVKKYTNNFSNSNIICAVQHATLYESEEMPSLGYSTIVKRISNTVYGRKMFETELSLLSKFQHQNIMKLMGYAIDDGGEMILVYYQLTKRTLRDVLLFGYRLGVSWMSRFKIIMGIAQALAYLRQQHPELRKLYSHLKPSNILLDEDMNPEIAIDFGHKYGDGSTTTEEFIINNDYATPESEVFCNKFDHSDVYFFGIIVLELVSGRRHCHSELDHNMILQAWNPWSIDKTFDLIDESIRKRALADPKEKVEMLRCIRIGISCTQRNSFDRPNNMSDVLDDLLSNNYASSPKIWRAITNRHGY